MAQNEYDDDDDNDDRDDDDDDDDDDDFWGVDSPITLSRTLE